MPKDICDEKIKKGQKVMKKAFPKMKFTEKEYKNMKRNCEKIYNNPGCKGTILEDGSPSKLPKGSADGLKRVFGKNNKTFRMFERLLKKERVQLFKGRKSVLKDNFFHKMSNKTVRNLKKQGATSGCTVFYKDP